MPELMKGHKWRDHKAKMTYPAWVEIKHDEIRCHVVVHPQTYAVEYQSYAGKPLHNLERFSAMWEEIARNSGVYEFDTGFEVNGNFNDSYRWVRSSRGLKENMLEWSAQFYLFDLPTLGTTYAERYAYMYAVSLHAAQHYPLGCAVSLPRGWWAHSAEDVDARYAQARSNGCEGVMVKDMQHLYNRGARSYGWLKVKPEDDADGIITAIHVAVSEAGVPHDYAGSVTIAVEDGSTASPHGIAHELGRDMIANPEKYIGQWAEFKYMERDRQGGYRHPVWGRLREAKA